MDCPGDNDSNRTLAASNQHEVTSNDDRLVLYWYEEGTENRKELRVPRNKDKQVNWEDVMSSFGAGAVHLFIPGRRPAVPSFDDSGWTHRSLALDSYRIEHIPLVWLSEEPVTMLEGDSDKKGLRRASSEEVYMSGTSGQDAAHEKAGRNLDIRAELPRFAKRLEESDPHKRLGCNLLQYYKVWDNCKSAQPFFFWLDEGAGRQLNLKECPRMQLEGQLIPSAATVTLYWKDEDGDEARGGHIEVPLLSRRRVDWSNVEEILGGPVQIFLSDRDAVSPSCEPFGYTRDSLPLDRYRIPRPPRDNDLPDPDYEIGEETELVPRKLHFGARTISGSLSLTSTSSTSSPGDSLGSSHSLLNTFFGSWRQKSSPKVGTLTSWLSKTFSRVSANDELSAANSHHHEE